MAVVWNHFFCCDSGIGPRSSVRKNLAAFYRKRTPRRDEWFGAERDQLTWCDRSKRPTASRRPTGWCPSTRGCDGQYLLGSRWAPTEWAAGLSRGRSVSGGVGFIGLTP